MLCCASPFMRYASKRTAMPWFSAAEFCLTQGMFCSSALTPQSIQATPKCVEALQAARRIVSCTPCSIHICMCSSCHACGDTCGCVYIRTCTQSRPHAENVCIDKMVKCRKVANMPTSTCTQKCAVRVCGYIASAALRQQPDRVEALADA